MALVRHGAVMSNRPVLAGALAGVLSLPSVALAQPEDTVFYSLGVHFLVHFGKEVDLGVGLDFRGTYVTRNLGDCEPRDAYWGIGGFGRITWHFPDFQFVIGPHIAFEAEDFSLVHDFDLGWTWTVSYMRGFPGLQLGYTVGNFPFEMSARVGVAFPKDGAQLEGQLGWGARMPGVFNDYGVTCISGRPLRVDGEQRLAAFTVGPRLAPPRHLAPETSRALGASWLEAARAEAASVPAFLALGRDLVRARAPRALMRRAVAAAREEVHHARLCEDLASRSAGVSLATHLPSTPVAPAEDRTALFTRLALESWHDGCVGEAVAARRAELAFEGCRDERTRVALGHIARDETRHAELAWSVLAFALNEGGPRVRDAVAAALATSSTSSSDDAETRGTQDVEPKTWKRLGRLDRAAVDRAHDEVTTRAAHRVRALLDRA